ncbi:MAG: DNA repair protein RecN [Saprospiraceae bacterium]|nr:DNA repair protein RecN [Saprospiraceae bacterium]
MIIRLDIRNYAIIDSVFVEFSKGLNIITGETGSGKSILMGALGLILGNRADTKVLSDKSRKCIIEGTFDIKAYQLQPYFIKEDLDYHDQTIIRREINTSGKSRAFINDSPVSLKTLQVLSGQLVDLHEQFENRGINESLQQINMLDALAKNEKLKKEYGQKHQAYHELMKTVEHLKDRHAEAIKQRDYVQFQLNELLEYDIDITSDSGLENKLNEAEHAQDIIAGLGNLSEGLENDEQAVISQLGRLQQTIDAISSLHEESKSLAKRLEAATLELEDIAQEAAQMAERIEYKPEETIRLRERVDALNQLMHKHRVNEIADLMQIQEAFDEQLQAFDTVEEDISEHEQELASRLKELKAIAKKLSKARAGAIPNFEKDVNKLLVHLRMEHANFKIEHVKDTSLNPHGQDRISYLFAPNKGSAHAPIKQVASGGEISRLSLITKSLVAGSLQMPTLIFDEIDSGVSGDVALKMGDILKVLSNEHQIISITHSPQVAAKGSRHFRVSKDVVKDKTIARVQVLNEEERVEEIATMLSSSPPSEAARTSAKELIHS